MGASLVGGWAAFEIGRGIADVDRLSSISGSLLRLLSPVRDIVLWTEISFWVGTLLGITAFVFDIVATVGATGGRWRSRIVLAAIGPVVSGRSCRFSCPSAPAAADASSGTAARSAAERERQDH